MGIVGQSSISQTFSTLYRRHFGLVWSLTAHFGVPAGAREDVAQEVWLAIHRRLDALRPDASSRAWVASITRNVALHHHRAHHRRARKHDALMALTELVRRPADTDELATLDVVLRRMDAAQREVFLLVAVEELSGPEVAEVLGVPVNTVYSRLRLARARLASAISSFDHEQTVAELRQPAAPRAATQRVWFALAAELTASSTKAAVLASTWAGKLAVAATSALATVIGTAALGGSGDSLVHGAAVDRRIVVEEASAPEIGSAMADAGEPLRSATRFEERAEVAEPPAVSGRWSPVMTPARTGRGGSVVARAVASPRGEARRRTKAPALTASSSGVVVADGVVVAGGAVDTLAVEAKLLGQASRALSDGDATLARSLLARHETEFPAGALASDRRAAQARLP